MARYSIVYVDPTQDPGKRKKEHVLEAASDAQARIRFLNLSWVAFTAIYVDSVALASDQPDEAKKKAKEDPLAGLLAHGYRGVGAPAPCAECRQQQDHRLHRGFEPIIEPPPDRTNAAGKRGAAAVKARGAGIDSHELDAVPYLTETAEIVSNLKRKHARDIASIPPPETSTRFDWRKECDRLTVKIGTLADEAQELSRKGEHDAADKLRAKARELAEQRAEITKRNRRK